MADIESLIPELEAVLGNGSTARRAEALRRITDLFLEDAGRYAPEHVALFDHVLGRLVIEIETGARAILARRLGPVHNAPVKVVGLLARDDDIKVAGPILLQSRRLEDFDLVEIARTKSQAHLLAIAGRGQVGPAVTDVLIGRGDGEVVRNVADNPGAQLSPSGISTLVRRAGTDGILAGKVRQRPDIPPLLMRDLVSRAAKVVQERLLVTAHPHAQAEIKRVLNNVATEVGTQLAPSRDYSTALRDVVAMSAKGGLGESQLAGMARAGRYDETIAALSVLCAVPIVTVDRLMRGERPDPVLVLCKAARFEWPTVRALIEVRAGKGPVSRHVFDSAFRNFERLSLATAQRVLRFWQGSQEALRPAG